MNDLIKKVSLSSLMVAMVFALSFGSFVPRARAVLTGDLVKGPNSDAVYYINGSMKHVFPDRKTYMTWYTNFNAVKTVTVSELDMFTTGAPVSYRPGTKLVTHPNTARVYAEEPGGVLRWITSEATALALYGSAWATWVNDVHELTFGNYTIGADMTSSAPSKGTILQKTGDPTIYYFDGTNIRPFASSAAFDANNLNYDFVVKVASLGTWTVGSSITGAETFATISGVGTGTITGPAGSLTVSLSPNTAPANGVLLAASARVPMVTVRMSTGSSDVIVDSVTIMRGGIASDAAFTDFDLLRGDTELPLNNTSKSLNSTHTATFNDDFTVPANATWDVIVAANMCETTSPNCLANYAGEYPIFSVTAVVLKNNSTLSGTLPITGNVMLTNGTIAAGTAQVAHGSNAPSATTKEVGTKDYIVSSIKIKNNSSETAQTLRVQSIIFTQNGSASFDDVENVRLINTNTGTTVATIAKLTSKKAQFLNVNVDISKGNQVNFDLKLDIKGGSARTISFEIDQRADIVVYDQLRAVKVLPSYSSTATFGGSAVGSSPFYNPLDTTVGNGKLRIESVAVSESNVQENKSGVLLGKFKFVMEGEAGNVTALGLHVATTTLGVQSGTDVPSDLTNLTLRDPNGNTVAGPKDPAKNQDLNGFTATTTDTITVPVGETVYSVYGDLNSDWTAGDKIQIGIYPGAVTLKGDITGNTIAATPSGQIQSTTLTIRSADLNVSVSASPAAQTIVAGSQDVEVANIVLDAADSGSNVRVTAFNVPIVTTGSAYPDVLTGIQLFVGSTEIPVSSRSTTYSGTGSTAGGSGTTTLTISAGNLTVIAKQSKTIRVVGDVGTGATSGTFSVGMQTTGVTVIDSEAQSFTADFTVGQGQAMTLVTGGTLNVAIAQDPKAALAVAGTTVNVGQFTAQAKFEGLLLNSFGFSVGNPDGGIDVGSDFNQLDSLEVWESGGSSALASVSVTGAASTVTPSSPISLALNAEKTYIVKAKFKSVLSPSAAKSGGGLAITMTNIDLDGTATGSATQTLSGLGAAFKTFSSFKSLPTVTMLPFTGSGSLTGNGVTANFMKFSVSANTAGPVGLAKFSFGVNTTTVSLSLTGFFLYESDSSGTQGNILSDTGDFQLIYNEAQGSLVAAARFDVNNDNPAAANVADRGEHLIVNAGATKYFTFRGTILTGHDGTASNESVSTVLAGDAAFAGTTQLTFGGIDDTNTGNDDFIWSDLNFDLYSTSSATETLGWFNGYRVAGMENTSSTAQTVND